MHKLRITIITANIDGPDIKISEECNKISEILQDQIDIGNVILIFKHQVHTDDLLNILKSTNPDILYFTGHGDKEWGYIFADEPDIVDDFNNRKYITNALKKYGKNFFCIVYNCCRSINISNDSSKFAFYSIGSTTEIYHGVIFAENFFKGIISDPKLNNMSFTQIHKNCIDAYCDYNEENQQSDWKLFKNPNIDYRKDFNLSMLGSDQLEIIETISNKIGQNFKISEKLKGKSDFEVEIYKGKVVGIRIQKVNSDLLFQEEISKLQTLKKIHLEAIPRIFLNKKIGKLVNLKHLKILNCSLKKIPQIIYKLKNLRTLNLSNNRIQKIPSSIQKLQKLEKIYLFHNLLTEISPKIKKMKNLKKVQMNDIRLKNTKGNRRVLKFLKEGTKLDLERELKFDYLKLIPKQGRIFHPPIKKSDNLSITNICTPYELSIWLNVDYKLIIKFCNAPNRGDYNYVRFKIMKRKPGEFRKILAPIDELKIIQKKINRKILKKFKTHESCYGFKIGTNTKQNALKHITPKILINLDIKDFFPSIHYDLIYNFFISQNIKPLISHVIATLCCFHPKECYNGNHDSREPFLPQGAPTSPPLSNLVCYKLDVSLTDISDKNGYSYSRYADDLSFSSNSKKFIHEDFISQIFCTISDYGFQVNKNKTYIAKKNQRQIITGIIVNNEEISVPRKWKRKLRAEIYKFSQDIKNSRLNPQEIKKKIEKIKSKCTYAISINKKHKNLKKKFDDILRSQNLIH